MKLRELKEKTAEELGKALREERERLRGLRFGVSIGQQSGVRMIRKSRKTIARILTLLKKGVNV